MNTREQLLDIISNGERLTARQAADRLGVSRARIYQILQEENATLPPPMDRSTGPAAKDHTHSKPRIITGGVNDPVNPRINGSVSELLVAADLTARKFQTYMPILRNSELYDLIAVNRTTGQIITIEVKSASRDEKGRIRRPHNNKARTSSNTKNATIEPTHIAMVLRGEPIVYSPEL